MKINNRLIEWKSSYELGIEDIDFQHHYFFNLIIRLSDELEKNPDIHYKNLLLSELSAYARFHFISEENLMHRYGYTGLERHKNFHLELLDTLSTKSNMVHIDGSEVNVFSVINFLINWFFQHTTTIDKEFAHFFHSLSKE